MWNKIWRYESIYANLDEFHGEMELECEQEILLRRKSVARPHNLVIVGNRKVPFLVPVKVNLFIVVLLLHVDFKKKFWVTARMGCEFAKIMPRMCISV